jgi:hypothetical protein
MQLLTASQRFGRTERPARKPKSPSQQERKLQLTTRTVPGFGPGAVRYSQIYRPLERGEAYRIATRCVNP